MKHWIYRLGAGIMAVLMLVSLCACKPNAGTTTTTAGEDTTTTVATDPTDPNEDVTDPTGGEDDPNADVTDPTEGEETDPTGEVTEPSEEETDPTDEVTEPSEDKVTTTEKAPTTTEKEPTTTGDKVESTTATTSKKPTTVKTTTTRYRPWLGATAPVRTTVQVTEAPTTTTEKKNYSTLAEIQYREEYAYHNSFGVHHTLLGYHGPESGVVSKNLWLPSIGYVVDGEIKDTMYDSIIMLPSPNYIYGPMTTKRAWDKWRDFTYENLAEVNAAAYEVQEALDLENYKVKVFLTILEPSIDRHSNWGDLNGVKYTCANDEERFEMVKYMIDSYITEMEELKDSLPNIDFVGYYWFDESLNTQKGAWYMRITDYVNSVGKIVVHAPYFKSNGWNYSKTYGFDLVGMQSNHFHDRPVSIGNSGSIARLDANAGYVANGDTHGITVEANHVEGDKGHDDMTTIKMTFEAALKRGTDHAYHIYYFGGGASSPYKMSRSSDEYIRSCYDDIYKYIHHTLTLEDLWIEDFISEQEWPDGVEDIL